MEALCFSETLGFTAESTHLSKPSRTSSSSSSSSSIPPRKSQMSNSLSFVTLQFSTQIAGVFLLIVFMFLFFLVVYFYSCCAILFRSRHAVISECTQIGLALITMAVLRLTSWLFFFSWLHGHVVQADDCTQ
jgi:hypothetical protein